MKTAILVWLAINAMTVVVLMLRSWYRDRKQSRLLSRFTNEELHRLGLR